MVKSRFPILLIIFMIVAGLVTVISVPHKALARVACPTGYHATADNNCAKNSTSSAPKDPCAGKTGKDKQACEVQQGKDALSNKNTNPAESAKSCNSDKNCKKIFTYLIDTVQLLSAAVGVVVVAMIIYGGIEFSTSAGDPEKSASAKNHIQNALIALFAFFFLWAFLNFLIPGGVFNHA